ncbi:MAG TPA: hypothetical protein ENG87_04005 [Candidatus Pacearchaeota archaeon]|nr:hypothetical protein [Candidatus Pacearchaeota archaeon]HDZ61195.1 hypothetical protein [Candidatus Pacearchaeota archaeon]
MFGKKKQVEQQIPAAIIDPTENQPIPAVQEQYAPQMQPAPTQQQAQQPVPQQTQQPVQNVPEAIIVQSFLTEEGTYKYLVETNYSLELGHCQLIK